MPISNYLEIHLDWLEILHSWLIGFVKTFMLSLMIRLRSLSVPATFEVLIQFNILKIPLSAEWLDFFSLSQAYYIITTQFLYQIVWYDHFEFQTLLFWFGGYWCKNTPRYAIYDIDIIVVYITVRTGHELTQQALQIFCTFLYMWLDVRLRRCHQPKNTYTFWHIKYFKIQLILMVKLLNFF